MTSNKTSHPDSRAQDPNHQIFLILGDFMSSVSKIGNICKVGGKLMQKTYVNKKYNNENFAKEGGLFTVPISFNRYVSNCSLLEHDTEVDIH